MPAIVFALGGLLISGLFGAATLLDKIDDLQDEPQKSLVNLGSGTMILIGGIAVWYLLKHK